MDMINRYGSKVWREARKGRVSSLAGSCIAGKSSAPPPQTKISTRATLLFKSNNEFLKYPYDIFI